MVYHYLFPILQRFILLFVYHPLTITGYHPWLWSVHLKSSMFYVCHSPFPPTSHSPHLPLISRSLSTHFSPLSPLTSPLTSPHPLTSPSPPHPLSSFTDRWYTTMLGKKSSVKNIKAYLRDKEVSQEADTFSLSALRGCASQCVLLGIRGDVEFCLFSLSLSSVMYVFLSSVMYIYHL